MFQVPAFWKSDLGTVERLAQMCGAREFGRSAGGTSAVRLCVWRAPGERGQRQLQFRLRRAR